MSDDIDQVRSDLAELIGLVRQLPTRTELRQTETRIRAEMRSFGTTLGRDMGRVLQKVEAIELRRDSEAESDRKNGNGKPRRPAVVR